MLLSCVWAKWEPGLAVIKVKALKGSKFRGDFGDFGEMAQRLLRDVFIIIAPYSNPFYLHGVLVEVLPGRVVLV
jgi:hypothetical protein